MYFRRHLTHDFACCLHLACVGRGMAPHAASCHERDPLLSPEVSFVTFLNMYEDIQNAFVNPSLEFLGQGRRPLWLVGPDVIGKIRLVMDHVATEHGLPQINTEYSPSSGMALWPCSPVALWPCEPVALWPCSLMVLRPYGPMAPWHTASRPPAPGMTIIRPGGSYARAVVVQEYDGVWFLPGLWRSVLP